MSALAVGSAVKSCLPRLCYWLFVLGSCDRVLTSARSPVSCPQFFDLLIRWPVSPSALLSIVRPPLCVRELTSALWPVSCPRFFDRLLHLGSASGRHFLLSAPWRDSLTRCYGRCPHSLPRCHGRCLSRICYQLFVLGSVAGCLPRRDGQYHALSSLTG